MATTLTFEAPASRLTLETRAKGMLAKLAHDLSIQATDLVCTASVDQGKLSLELHVPIAGLRVEGARKNGVVDKSVLSTSDRNDIERKIREEVLPNTEIVVRASCDAPSSLLEPGTHEVASGLTVERGRSRAEVRTRASVETTESRVVAKGRATVTLPSLGVAPVKGPLNAFRVDDDIEIVYALAFER